MQDNGQGQEEEQEQGKEVGRITSISPPSPPILNF